MFTKNTPSSERSRERSKSTPLSQEDGNTHAVPLILLMGGGGGGVRASACFSNRKLMRENKVSFTSQSYTAAWGILYEIVSLSAVLMRVNGRILNFV